ncbi:transposon-transfer assisting family protein [Oscillospiraceae bacterium MB24-C1]|nr:transposon-transfer assisting family protein [Oscillospiraceae bacterium MB24-C1]
MNVCFNLEELALMGAYNPENGRLAMINTLTEELTFTGDVLVAETTRSALAKLHTISDAEYSSQNFMLAKVLE